MSAKRTQPDEPAGAKKKSKPNVSPCDITSFSIFHENFKEHKINSKKRSFTCSTGWNTATGKAEIAAWLKSVSGEQVRMYGRIKRNSVAALYPLILTALLPVFDLGNCSATGNIVSALERDDMELIAAKIAASQFLQGSHQASAEGSGPEEGAALPQTIDISNENEVLLFVEHIAKRLNSNVNTTKGRVEILIKDEKTGKIVAVIEARPNISNSEPNDTGFYQYCAYMALHDVPFGIFTDHKAFQFVRMDEKKVLHPSKLFDLMKSEYDCLDEEATEVYAHLFEVMGVPRATNLLAKGAESAASWAERAAVLTERLH